LTLWQCAAKVIAPLLLSYLYDVVRVAVTVCFELFIYLKIEDVITVTESCIQE